MSTPQMAPIFSRGEEFSSQTGTGGIKIGLPSGPRTGKIHTEGLE
jgi:hypothetical protein